MEGVNRGHLYPNNLVPTEGGDRQNAVVPLTNNIVPRSETSPIQAGNMFTFGGPEFRPWPRVPQPGGEGRREEQEAQ